MDFFCDYEDLLRLLSDSFAVGFYGAEDGSLECVDEAHLWNKEDDEPLTYLDILPDVAERLDPIFEGAQWINSSAITPSEDEGVASQAPSSYNDSEYVFSSFIGEDEIENDPIFEDDWGIGWGDQYQRKRNLSDPLLMAVNTEYMESNEPQCQQLLDPSNDPEALWPPTVRPLENEETESGIYTTLPGTRPMQF